MIILFIIVGILIARVARRGRAPDKDRDATEQAATPETKYTPAGDEGLGAAIAIVIDNSGSMEKVARGDSRPKYLVARDAVTEMLAATDSFVARQPDFPIKVGLYHFATRVTPAVTIQRYDRAILNVALSAMPLPEGGTAIGDAMDAARRDLYRAGVIRKHILVITDGENTDGRSPRSVAREIARRSEGAVRMYFVAFDVDAEKFSFVRDVRGEVLGAGNGPALRSSLNAIYRGKILAEAMDAGERPTPPSGASRSSSDSIRAKQP